MNTAMQKPRVLFSSPYHSQPSPAKQDAALEQASSDDDDDAQDNSGSAGEEEGNEKIDGIMLSLDDDEKMQLFDTLTQYFKSQESSKDEVDISDMTTQEET